MRRRGTVALTDRRLRVALPWLDRALLESGANTDRRLPDTEWLLARATRRGVAHDWREWLLEGTSLGPGLLERFPPGPCLRAARGGMRPAGVWACAAPVHLVAALDHLRLAEPAPLPLEAQESRDLVADLNERLAGRGFTLHDSAGSWLCECPAGLDCAAPEPAVAIGRNLREMMPSGRDAARVIAWVNELQMVLHEHPLNSRRAARGQPRVNSVWLWGFGVAGTPGGTPRDVLLTDDEWLAGLWRLHGADPVEPARLGTVLDGHAQSLRVGLASTRWADSIDAALEAIELRLAGPLRSAIEARTVTGVSILCGDVVREFGRGSRWRIWRRPRPLRELLA